MNKSTLLIGTIAVIVFLGMITYLALHQKSMQHEMGNTTPQFASTPTPSKITGSAMETSFKDLLSLGGNHVCTYSYYTNGVKEQGKVFINGENVQATFMPKQATVNVIANKTIFYIWTSSENGYTLPRSSVDKFNAVVSAELVPQFDINKKERYLCNGPSVQPAFSLPSTITFPAYKE